jgi:hypothetical protein
MKVKKILVCALPLISIAVLKCIAKTYKGLIANKFLPCWFNLSTGLLCPGCGGTRSFYALLSGNILDSLKYNAFVPLMTLISIILYCRLFLKVMLHKNVTVLPKNDKWVYIPLVLFLVYFVLRNIV